MRCRDPRTARILSPQISSCNRLVTGVRESSACFMRSRSAGVLARRKLKDFNAETQRRRDFTGWRRDRRRGRTSVCSSTGKQNACPSLCSAIEPETILPHSGRRLVGTLALHCLLRRLVGTLALHCLLRRLVGTLALHCLLRRLVGTLALQIMLIMLIMSKNVSPFSPETHDLRTPPVTNRLHFVALRT